MDNKLRTLFVLAAVAALPSGSGLVLVVPPGATLTNVEVPSGEDLLIVSAGDLVVAGRLRTAATDGPGASGPGISIAAAGTLILLPDAFLLAADGRDGASAFQEGLAVASPGGRGGSVRLEAQSIQANGATVQAGDGGNGGAAFARGTPNAWATGGDGGDAGSVQVFGTIAGALRGLVAHGGNGGKAQAIAADGQDCSGADGAPATARGEDAVGIGHGGDANATATPGQCGPVDGQGGRGGDASAYGGNGGTAPDGNGGNGGNATAIGGNGGDGTHACFASTKEAEASGIQHAGNGGNGGNATAIGGNGGNGLFVGGRGGGAFAREEGGNGGNATLPIGYGNGGANSGGGGRVKAGDGGIGMDGGGGGDAVGTGQSGGGGIHCGPLPSRSIFTDPELPLPGAVPVLVLLTLLAVLVRRRNG